MTAAPINGHDTAGVPTVPEPKGVIARWIYEADFADGDTPWDELADDEREALENFAADYIGCHMRFLNEHGFRLLPPGAVLRPKTDEEAAAMEHGIRLYREAASRKGGLVGSVAPKLILPPGVH